MARKTDTDCNDIYSRITDRIVEDLEQGVRPWIKPWSATNTDGRITRPVRRNGLPYSGMNVLLLWSEQVSRGFSSSMWMTFKQSLELGGAVRKGETGSSVVFASRFTKSVADGNGNDVDREIPFLKAYSVFNIEQIDGLPDSYYAPPARCGILSSASRAPIASSKRQAGHPARRQPGLLLAGHGLYPDAALRDVSRCCWIRGRPQP